MSEDAQRRRSFPEAFKLETVAAIRGGRSVSQVAAELGLPDRLVRSWLRWAEGRVPEASGAPCRGEPGAAWKKVSESGVAYLSVSLDDPSFPAPVFAALIPTEADPDRFNLAWSRPRNQEEDGY